LKFNLIDTQCNMAAAAGKNAEEQSQAMRTLRPKTLRSTEIITCVTTADELTGAIIPVEKDFDFNLLTRIENLQERLDEAKTNADRERALMLAFPHMFSLQQDQDLRSHIVGRFVEQGLDVHIGGTVEGNNKVEIAVVKMDGVVVEDADGNRYMLAQY
jgi:hypothetical protein